MDRIENDWGPYFTDDAVLRHDCEIPDKLVKADRHVLDIDPRESKMDEIKCEICGNPATIHETIIENGQTITQHLCQEHGQHVWSLIPREEEAITQLSEWYQNLSEEEKRQVKQEYRMMKRGG